MVIAAPVVVEEVERRCAACLAVLPPKQRAYCAGGICKQLVRLWRLKMSLAVKS